jgi:hypothetical protein
MSSGGNSRKRGRRGRFPHRESGESRILGAIPRRTRRPGCPALSRARLSNRRLRPTAYVISVGNPRVNRSVPLMTRRQGVGWRAWVEPIHLSLNGRCNRLVVDSAEPSRSRISSTWVGSRREPDRLCATVRSPRVATSRRPTAEARGRRAPRHDRATRTSPAPSGTDQTQQRNPCQKRDYGILGAVWSGMPVPRKVERRFGMSPDHSGHG